MTACSFSCFLIVVSSLLVILNVTYIIYGFSSKQLHFQNPDGITWSVAVFLNLAGSVFILIAAVFRARIMLKVARWLAVALGNGMIIILIYYVLFSRTNGIFQTDEHWNAKKTVDVVYFSVVAVLFFFAAGIVHLAIRKIDQEGMESLRTRVGNSQNIRDELPPQPTTSKPQDEAVY